VQIEELFKLQPRHKEAVAKIAALCGVKQEVVLMVMEYVVYSSLIESLDSASDEIRIELPLIGTIKIPTKTDIDYHGMTIKAQQPGDPEIEVLPAIRKALVAAKGGDASAISAYFDRRWIGELVEEASNG
jgi:hypothetical protein